MRKILFVLMFLLFSSFILFSGDVSVPPINFSASLIKTGLILSYKVPYGYYTYISSPYAKPLKIEVVPNEFYIFSSAVLPEGRYKGEEKILSGSGKIKIPIMAIGSSSPQGNVPLEVKVSYQLCKAAQGICYAPQETTITFRVKMQNKKVIKRRINPYNNKFERFNNKLYRGKNSGDRIKISEKNRIVGFRAITHYRKNISVYNRLRLSAKAYAGSDVYTSVYYWKNKKWNMVYSPWKYEEMNSNGVFNLELFFPEAGDYTISIKGREKGGKKNKYLCFYKVKVETGFEDAKIPAMPKQKFFKDGFKLISHKNAVITAGEELTVRIKGHPKSWGYVYLVDNTDGKYKNLYSPWQTKHVDKNGNYTYKMIFPHVGNYSLSIYGRSRWKDKKSTYYFSYKIKCKKAYDRNTMPVQINKDFARLGFQKGGLSHPYYNVKTGRSLKLILRGKPGVAVKAQFFRSKPWKKFEYAPRVFVMPKNGTYTIFNYFPKAGEYSLYIKAEVTKKGDRYRKYSNIVQYNVIASGGYTDRSLDIKMGYYTGEEKYKKKAKAKKVIFGSAGDLMWVKDMNKAEKISKAQSRIILILHSATWCGYCKKLKKETFRDPALVRYARKRFVAIEVGASKIKGMATYNKKYKKHKGGIPSVSFIAPDGKHLLTRTGYSAGSYYIKILKNVVAMKGGLITRYLRYHKAGYKKYSFKLIELYQSLGQKYKASKIIIDLINARKIPQRDLPKYYLQVGKASWGKTAQKYYRKIINGYSYQIGYYWYQAVYKLAIQLYGGGYGGYSAEILRQNEDAAIKFIKPYTTRSYYSPLWLSWYNSLIGSIKNHAASKRKKKGWTSSYATGSDPWFDKTQKRDVSKKGK